LQRQVASCEEIFMDDDNSDIPNPELDRIANVLEQLPLHASHNPSQLAAFYLGLTGNKRLSKSDQRKLLAKTRKIKKNASKTVKATEQKLAKQVQGTFNKQK
jgi:signal recognition particle subunit SEC65